MNTIKTLLLVLVGLQAVNFGFTALSKIQVEVKSPSIIDRGAVIEQTVEQWR